jgi:hypothetical protein
VGKVALSFSILENEISLHILVLAIPETHEVSLAFLEDAELDHQISFVGRRIVLK